MFSLQLNLNLTSICLLFRCFTNSYLFLPVANQKLFCFDFQNNLRFAAGKNRYLRMCKNTETNKQSVVIFWPNWRQYGLDLYWFSCICNQILCKSSHSRTAWHTFFEEKINTLLRPKHFNSERRLKISWNCNFTRFSFDVHFLNDGSFIKQNNLPLMIIIRALADAIFFTHR